MGGRALGWVRDRGNGEEPVGACVSLGLSDAVELTEEDCDDELHVVCQVPSPLPSAPLTGLSGGPSWYRFLSHSRGLGFASRMPG